MKKSVVFAVFFALLASAVSAEVFVTGSAGYSAVALDEVKSEYNDAKEFWDALVSSSATKDHSEPGHAIFAKLDIMVPVLPLINLGPRFGAISALQTRLSYALAGDEITNKQDALAVPLMLGANASIPLGSDVSINASAFGGYALALVTDTTFSKLSNIIVSDYAVNYGGGALALDFSGGVDIKLANFIKAGISVGYRVCKFTELKATEEVKYNSLVVAEKDELLENSDGNALTVDMSGIDVGLGITIIF